MARSITAIINVQALEWENRRRAAGEHADVLRHQRPVVTVSSEHGSRGHLVAERAARQLEFDLYDRELLNRIVASANASRRIVESLDDRVQDWITEHIASQFQARQFSSGDFMKHLSHVVLAIAHHGRAVIVGRGAQFILDPKLTLRVRTIAPFPVRVREVAQAEGVSEKEARGAISRRTEERNAFCRLHFDRDVSAPENYDLLINTADQPLELCAITIVHAFQERFAHTR